MSLDDLVTVNITKQTATVSQVGFGVPLIAAYHTKNLDIVRSYGSLADVAADFSVVDAAYKAASAAFGQNPRPTKIKIGRRTLPVTQTVRILPTSAVAGVIYKLSIKSRASLAATTETQKDVTYTVPGSSSISAICTALAAAITTAAPPGVTAAASATYVTLTSGVAGLLFDLFALNDELEVQDVTADPGVATDLALFRAADDDWYGLALDSNSKAEVIAAAAWSQSNNKLFAANTMDADVAKSGASDLASTLQASSYDHTFLSFKRDRLLNYFGAAWLGSQLPYEPGSGTWMFKELLGQAYDKLTPTQITQIKSKSANWYERIAGSNITQEGWTTSGQFIDVTHVVDWLQARVKEAVFGTLKNNRKVAFTDGGIQLIKDAVRSVLMQGVRNGAISEGRPDDVTDPGPTVTAPGATAVDQNSRAARILTGLQFSCRLTGAIHHVVINGTVSV